MPYSKEKIQERYNKLPTDIKQAMDSVNTTKTVVDIGQKYDLMYDQISELVDEVGLTMIGITPEAVFVNNIARRMQVDMGKAMLIAKDINKEIFDKMRDSLKNIEGLDEEGFNEENENATHKNNQFGQGEETMMTDAEKAQQKSVISAVEKAGGFVIDKQEEAPLLAEEMVHDAMKENLESKKNIINILEKESLEPGGKMTGNPVTPASAGVLELSQDSRSPEQAIRPSHEARHDFAKSSVDSPVDGMRGNDKKSEDEKIESSVPPDHLLGDTPESPLPQTSIKQTPTQQATKNNATNAEKQLDQASIVDTLLAHGVAMTMEEPSKQDANSTKTKVRPYDGTDPYREPAE
jgi:hypothetical protein